jgi:CRISPR-associated protein (TIGR03986 family)
MYEGADTVGITNNVNNKDECWAIIEKEPRLKDKGKIKFYYWNAIEIWPIDKKQTEISYDSASCFLVRGYFFKSNKNIENKHDERIFFEEGSSSCSLLLESNVINNYETVLKDYISRHQEEIVDRQKISSKCKPDEADENNNAFSQFIIDGESKIKSGDLLYVGVDNLHNPEKIEFIAPVSIARLLFKNSIAELLKSNFSELTSCDYFNDKHQIKELKLCPACRTFGWVRQTNSSNKISAFAGKIIFSDGSFSQPPIKIENITLPILGQPKPTTTPFYLLNQKRQLSFTVDYNIHSSYIRGRKFYWHHGVLNENEYKIEKKSKHNCTIKNALKEGEFAFDISFNNLTDFELGALLYSIKLENKWQHHLGYAKPFGFGSLNLKSMQLFIKKTESNYHSLGSGYTESTKENIDGIIEQFFSEYKEVFGVRFKETDTFADMNELFGKPSPVPVHYPRKTFKLDENGKQFEWFQDNNRINKKPLPLAERETEEDFLL